MYPDIIPADDLEVLPHGIVLTITDRNGTRVVPIHWRDLTIEHADISLIVTGPAGSYEWPHAERPDKYTATEDEWAAWDETLTTNSERAQAVYLYLMTRWYAWARESLGFVPGGPHD